MRKVLAIVLCILLLISATPASAESIVQLSVNTDHLQVVKALGIMDAFSNNDSDASQITRGEFASIICKLMNMHDMQTAQKPEFADVNEGHVYYHQIATVHSQKIMVGDENGNFMPNTYVTYEQAVKCLLYILGYEVQAEKNGGYPLGYAICASKLDILENVNYNQGNFVSRAELAQMVYNCLDVELVELTSVTNKAGYNTKTRSTILGKYMGIRKFEAVVNSVDGRSMLSRNKDTAEGSVKIGSTVLNYSDTYVPSLLGYMVEAYATDGNADAEKLLYAFPTSDNNELMIKIGDLNTDSPEFSLRKFCYKTQTGKTQTADLSKEHRFMYNDVYDLDFDIDDLDFPTGYVKLIDHNDDDVYDVCFIWNYENYVCESVAEDVINCHYKKTLRRDKNNNVTYRVLGNDGIWGGWEQLLKLSNWDVLSVARSKDGSLVTIIPTRSGVGGTVEAIVEDDNTYVLINGYEYAVSEQYMSLPENTGFTPMKSGLRSEFYFDVIGEIAAVYKVSSEENAYAYAIDAATKGTLSKQYEIKLFDHKGKVQIFDIADKIKFSSDVYELKTYKTADVMNLFYDEAGYFIPQMICYSVNDEGVVTAIDKYTNATALGYNLDKFSMDFDAITTSETYNFQNSTSSFVHESSYNHVFHLSGTTKVFYLPCNNGEVVEDDMQIVDASIFENNDDYANMQVFDCDDTYTASVLLYMPDASADSDVEVLDSYFLAINSVYMGKDKDGEFQPMVKGFLRGVEEEFVYTSLDGSVPEPGSIVQCQKTLKGELKIHSDYVIYSPSKGLTLTERTVIKGSGRFPTIWSQTGRLWRKNGSAVSVYVGQERPWAAYLNGSIVYKYSDETRKFESADESILIPSTGSPQSLPDGTLMVLNYRYHYIREIFVIEE